MSAWTKDRHPPLNLWVAKPKSVLAFHQTRDSANLVRADAATLRPRPGPRLMIAGHTQAWSFSPNGRLLALGDNMGGEVWLVDTRRLRLAGRISADDYGSVLETAWLGGRLLAVVERCCWSDEPATDEGLTLAVLDPVAKRVLSRRDVAGSLQRAARTDSKLVLLLGPRDRLGPARLATVDADGRLKDAQLERIVAGREFRDGEAVARTSTPGFAVDGAGNRAFVVAAGAPVAEVDLETMALSYHELSTPISLLGRLRSWLEPAAEAKFLPHGPDRQARWLGDGMLAVWGLDSEVSQNQYGNPVVRQLAAGVQLIDTRDWSVRTLDPHASELVVGDGSLLTFGSLWDSGVQSSSGTGLTGFGPDTAQRFHLFGSRPLIFVRAVGPRVFVQDAQRSYSVLDARTGRLIRRVAGFMPEPLVR
jgi:hypothetical protein